MKQLATVVFVLPLILLVVFFIVAAQPLAIDGTLLPTVPFSRLTLGSMGPVLFLLLTYCLGCPIGFFFADLFQLILGRGDGRYRRPLIRRLQVGRVWLDKFAVLAILPFLYGLSYLFVYAYLSGAVPLRMLFAVTCGVLQGTAAFGLIRSNRLVCFWEGLGHVPASVSRTQTAKRFFGIANIAIGIVVASVLLIGFIPPYPWARPKVDGKPTIVDAACVRVEEVYSSAAEDRIVVGAFPFPTIHLKKRPDRQELAVTDLKALLSEDDDVAIRFLEGSLDRADECLLRASRALWENGSWGPWTFRELDISLEGDSGPLDSPTQRTIESLKRTAQFADLVGCEMPILLRKIDLSEAAIRSAPSSAAAARKAFLWIAAQHPEEAIRTFNTSSAHRSVFEFSDEIRSESRPFYHGTDSVNGVHHIVAAIPESNRDRAQAYQYPTNIVLFTQLTDESDREIRIRDAEEVISAREAFYNEWEGKDQDGHPSTQSFYQLTEVAGIGVKKHAKSLTVRLRHHSTIRVVELDLAPAKSERQLPKAERPGDSGADFLLVTVAGKPPYLVPDVPVSAVNPIHAVLDKQGRNTSATFLRRHAPGHNGAVTPRAFFLNETGIGGWFFYQPKPTQNIINFSYARFSAPVDSSAQPRCLTEVVHSDGITSLIQVVDQCKKMADGQSNRRSVNAEGVYSLQGILLASGCPLLGFEYPSPLKDWLPKLTATAFEVSFQLQPDGTRNKGATNRLCREAAEDRNLPRNADWTLAVVPDGVMTHTCTARFWIGYRPSGSQQLN